VDGTNQSRLARRQPARAARRGGPLREKPCSTLPPRCCRSGFGPCGLERSRRATPEASGGSEPLRPYLRLWRMRFRRLRYLCREIFRRRFLMTELIRAGILPHAHPWCQDEPAGARVSLDLRLYGPQTGATGRECGRRARHPPRLDLRLYGPQAGATVPARCRMAPRHGRPPFSVSEYRSRGGGATVGPRSPLPRAGEGQGVRGGLSPRRSEGGEATVVEIRSPWAFVPPLRGAEGAAGPSRTAGPGGAGVRRGLGRRE
jgi:hypothetical protein